MAADANIVWLVGRPTRDPEMRGAANNVAAIRLAVTSRTKQGEEWGDKSNFFDVAAFGRTAEFVEKYVTKGRRIGIEGRLDWREWETDDGGKRQAVQVIANQVFFLDSKRDEDGGGGARATDDLAPRGRPAAAADDDDDIPF